MTSSPSANGPFIRIQCKTGVLQDRSALAFPTCSSLAHRGGGFPTYGGQIEYFGVYCSQLDACYLVPYEEVKHCARLAKLRLEPAKNGQIKGTRPADAYRI